MAAAQRRAISRFIEPFRVTPGKKVVLARDFDPAYVDGGLTRERGEELLAQVWEIRGEVNTRTVDVHVRRLRVSLGPAADVIETVHGFGYRARREISSSAT